MFKSIHIDGKAIKRVVSNGRVIWKKTTEMTLKFNNIRHNNISGQTIIDIPTNENFENLKAEHIDLLKINGVSIPGDEIYSVNFDIGEINLQNSPSYYGLPEGISGTLTIQLK